MILKPSALREQTCPKSQGEESTGPKLPTQLFARLSWHLDVGDPEEGLNGKMQVPK